MIKNIKVLPGKLNIIFSNNKEDNFPNIWIRDHARDDESWDSRSNQRKIFTAKIDPKLLIKKATLRDNGNSIDILWSDLNKPINYPSFFFIENSSHSIKNVNNFKIWKKKDIQNDIFIDFEKVISTEGFKIFLKKLHNYGFAVIKNCNTEMSSVEKIAKKIGYVRHSIFGGLWRFESNQDMADSAYTQEELRPHTDATYSNDAPGLQLLLCCHYKATGGESIIVDGFKIAQKLKKDTKELYDILTEIEVTGRYMGDGVFLESKRPIFKLNSNKELIQVSFNNYDRAPFRINERKTLKFYQAIKEFDLIANDEDYQWKYILKPGELLIFNNWRVLHGRGSFKGERKISGCYINKEDFDSICRINKII